jgi:hypothetical protein
MQETLVKRINSFSLSGDSLPDGSVAMVDEFSSAVFSLNQMAYTAFDSCKEDCDLDTLRTRMSRKLDLDVPLEAVKEAVSELEAVGLVKCYAANPPALDESRREVLQGFAKASGYAIPAAMVLRASEQKLFAQSAGSPPPTTTTTTTTTPAPTTTTTTTPAPTTTTTTTTPGVIAGTATPNCANDPSLSGNVRIFAISSAGAAFVTGQTTATVQGSGGTQPNNLTVSSLTVNSATSASVTIQGFNGFLNNGGTSLVVTLTTPGAPTVTCTIPVACIA